MSVLVARRLGVLTVTASLLGLAMAQSASASWTVQSVPLPATQTSVVLSEVSCSSASACIAVGSFTNLSTGDGVTLAARWNGTQWTIQSPPNPAGAVTSELSGVSCTSASACVAVGSSSNDSSGDAPVMLAEVWNGAQWVIQSTPQPVGASVSQLNGVSCTSATACVAVGSSGGDETLVEVWNGLGWTVQGSPSPGARASFSGVSCSSANACVAVGSSGRFSGSNETSAMLAEVWNGANWTVEATPGPAGSNDAGLDGVSCTSSAACTAVGSTSNDFGNNFASVAESWDGSSWTYHSIPSSKGEFLTNVSCTSSTACVAVGSVTRRPNQSTGVAEDWDGSAWTRHSTPGLRSSLVGFDGVSCVTATQCTAVGSASNCRTPDECVSGNGITYHSLAETLDGGAGWKVQKTQDPTAATGALSGVSCISATTCVAVGTYTARSGNGLSLTERWDGLGWRSQGAGSENGALSSVACTSARACATVGSSYVDDHFTQTLADEWNGAGWKFEATPNHIWPFGSLDGDDELLGVACWSKTACVAVGSAIEDGTNQTVQLVQRWNGRRWSTVKVKPLAPGSQPNLAGVSCGSKTSCTAVGTYGPASDGVTLVEHWNGAKWSVQRTPKPRSSLIYDLAGVSCKSAKTCVAVGSVTSKNGNQLPLVERWNGSRWSIQRTPALVGVTEATLNGVSCASANACVAVGSAGQLPLVERWNGTGWSVQQTPGLGGSGAASLSGVSCTSKTLCTAVGTLGSGVLVERSS